jgi:hypothetical protein
MGHLIAGAIDDCLTNKALVFNFIKTKILDEQSHHVCLQTCN